MAGHYPPPPPPPRPPAPPYGRPPYGGPPYGGPPYGAPPPHGPGYGPPAYGQPQYHYVRMRPPPRRSAGGTIAGIFGGLTALVVVAILGLAAFGGTRDAAGGTGTTASPGGGTGPASAKEKATGSKLYRTGSLTPVSCRLPEIQPSAESMRQFMETLSDCLDASWARQFQKAGITFDRPKRVFWVEPGRSPCGSYPAPGASAFYCPANNTMYVGLKHVVETSGGEPLSHYAVYARVIAHEYGHHVQDRAGILLYGDRQIETGDRATGNEASRRIELQAQCFAGAFLGSERATLPMTREQYVAMIVDVRGRGEDRKPPDERDHGLGRHYAGWVITGFDGRDLTVCNTWTAPSSQVS
ncbi:neutral zinc metallopeptidase [Actinomadura chokoriensis]|uniref:Neutral zinc metallopeptidase n=1 Tax=Actinomadura chokoriensis TaxID=454156 RepID=A0ABV4R729_9ACTN